MTDGMICSAVGLLGMGNPCLLAAGHRGFHRAEAGSWPQSGGAPFPAPLPVPDAPRSRPRFGSPEPVVVAEHAPETLVPIAVGQVGLDEVAGGVEDQGRADPETLREAGVPHATIVRPTEAQVDVPSVKELTPRQRRREEKRAAAAVDAALRADAEQGAEAAARAVEQTERLVVDESEVAALRSEARIVAQAPRFDPRSPIAYPAGTRPDTGPVDHVLADGRWVFDERVTEVFDDMLARSIPQYDVMRELTFALGSTFVKPQSTVVDLGASRGEAIAPYLDRFGARNRYTLVEVSEPMRATMRRRFEGLISASVVDVRGDDLRFSYPPVVNVSLTLCVLTAMFVPIEHRQRLLRDVYESLAPQGALLLVEKVIGEGSLLDKLYVEQYLTMKASHGYSAEEIERKRLALEGVLVPVTEQWNRDMLHRAGFSVVDTYWRWLNFVGYVAVKR